MRSLALGLVITTTIFMIVPIIGLFYGAWELLAAHWDIYLLFVALPYSAAGILFYASRKHGRKAGE